MSIKRKYFRLHSILNRKLCHLNEPIGNILRQTNSLLSNECSWYNILVYAKAYRNQSETKKAIGTY